MSVCLEGLLGGPCVVTNVVISRVTIPITFVKGLITPLITTHEPSSRCRFRPHPLGFDFMFWNRFRTRGDLSTMQPLAQCPEQLRLGDESSVARMDDAVFDRQNSRNSESLKFRV